MTRAELEMVADHLGHSVNIHTGVYKMQQNNTDILWKMYKIKRTYPHYITYIIMLALNYTQPCTDSFSFIL